MMGPGKKRLFLLPLLLLAAFTACKNNQSRLLTINGLTMGTSYSIRTLWRPQNALSPEEAKSVLRNRVNARLEELNLLFSTFRPDSEISAFNNAAENDWFQVSPLTGLVVSRSLEISRLTGGAFDITVAPLVKTWGFWDADKPRSLPTDEQISRAMARTGYSFLEIEADGSALRKLKPGMMIDLAAIAKGFAVDQLADLLEAEGYSDFLVEIGGELKARGRNEQKDPWRVGILRPDTESMSLQRVISLSDLALATSGDYYNFIESEGKRYSHTIDPRSGRPVEHDLASVSVLAESCLEADALATALNVLGPEEGLRLALNRGWAALLISRRGDSFREEMTPAFRVLLEK